MQEMPVKDGNAATQEIRHLQDNGKAGYSHILGVSANVRESQTNSMRDAGMDDIISKPFKVDDLVKRIRSIVLEAKPDKKGHADKNSTPAEETGNNKEVQVLEDLPIRSRSGQDRWEKSEQGKRNEEGSRDSSGSATVHLDGKEQVKGQDGRDQGKDESRESQGNEPGGGEKVAKAQAHRNEGQENSDRRAGQAGELSGREGESRGGERSRSRDTRGK